MKFKFGDRVIIKDKDSFHDGLEGSIVNYRPVAYFSHFEDLPERYIVQLYDYVYEVTVLAQNLIKKED